MTVPLVAGNWKMNGTRARCIALAREINAGARSVTGVSLAIFPPHPYLLAVRNALGEEPLVTLGAQDASWRAEGALTGEVSPAMLEDVGCRRVILGHSERRHEIGESDARIRGKLEASLAASLDPILCVGETEPEREGGRTDEVLERQIQRALAGLDPGVRDLVVAYEPVWAIGTGRRADPTVIASAHATIRRHLEGHLGAQRSRRVRILYGGSVKPENAKGLFAIEGVDGALVGGASLSGASFLAIAAAAGSPV